MNAKQKSRSLPSVLRAARKRLGLSPAQVAAACSACEGTIHRIEAGRHFPRGPLLLALARFLRVDLSSVES